MDEVRTVRVVGPDLGAKLTAVEAMRLAIREGRRGTGFVAPNPLVGCVILDSERRLLAFGHHARVGFDHAEAAALKKIRNVKKVQGAHVFVTLEPCAHEGRTPPCALALAKLKPASVTYAVEDPFPQVSGRGAEILREAGIQTRSLAERRDIPERERRSLIDDAEDLAEIFLHNQRVGLPFVAVKIASSLDGRIAFESGESKWITGESARRHAHFVRARYDAVAVGVGTFENDDPSLDVRLERFEGLQNKAVVFDPSGRSLARLSGSNLYRARGAEKVIVVIDRESKVKVGARLLRARVRDGRFDLDEVLKGLKAEGITSIMVEGGAHTVAGFFEARRVQRLHAYLAPTVFGGKHSVAWSQGFGTTSLKDRIHLVRSKRRLIGDDLYWTARIVFSQEPSL